jgi:tRNA dimethylallyltransferase
MTQAIKKKAYIICGPTCSGKSQLALKLAKATKGILINADSVQVYNELPILSASPSREDKNSAIPIKNEENGQANDCRAAQRTSLYVSSGDREVQRRQGFILDGYNHFLYNFLTPTIKYNVADYIKDCTKILLQTGEQNIVPIIVGGTGMYINALMEGISFIPEVSSGIKDQITKIIDSEGIAHVHSLLAKLDPIMANKLPKNDTQRISRSYEIFLQTGKSILEFQSIKEDPILKNYDVQTIYLKPERQFLYNLCNERFLAMLENGALEEALNFQKNYPSISHGVVKALGFKELISYSKNEISMY